MLTRRTDFIAELLDDPMVQVVMQADQVDRETLEGELRVLACRLESAVRVATPSRLQGSREPILSVSVGTRPPAHLAVAIKAGPVACGACC
jgi:hypothetical protein